MNIKNFLKQNNIKFFEAPESKIKNKLMSRKFPLDNFFIEQEDPCVFLCFNTTKFDKNLISTTIKSSHVFLAKETIQKAEMNKLTKTEIDEIISEIKVLKQQNISIVIINGLYPSIFGKNQNISQNLANLLYKTDLTIKILTFAGSYFSNPIWSSVFRKCKVYPSQQLTIPHQYMEGFNEKELYKYFNSVIPASANIYSLKYPVSLNSNKLAEGLETIVYCCPKCKTLFSVYSEFSCLKCRKCNNAIELSKNGQILFSKNIKTFDDVEDFLYNSLTKNGFNNNALICYENIILKSSLNSKQKDDKTVNLSIFADHFIISNDTTKTEYNFEDIDRINLSFDNTVVINTSKKEIILQGKNKENFYIMCDLIKLNK